jgi:oligopeptide transport system substrate-binding protein
MYSKSLRWTTGLLLAFVILWSTAGCNLLAPASSTSSSPGASDTVVETPRPGAPPDLAKSQVLNLVGGTSEATTIDPALVRDTQASFLARQIFSGLVTLDDDLNVVPDLAAQLPDISSDGRTYTFTLRSGAKFQDGREVTAEDVKYSLERACDPSVDPTGQGANLPAATYLNDIVGASDKLAGKASELSGIVVKDDRTVAITIDAPKSYFLSKLTYSTAFVVDRSNVEDSGSDWWKKPNGTGPFKLKEWKTGDHITLTRNSSYYGGAPFLAQINLALGVNATGTMTQYEQDKLDVIDVPFSDLERVLDDTNPLSRQVSVVPALSLTYIGLNTTVKPFDDPKIRQAFYYALDRTKIAQVMYESKVQEAKGVVPPDMPNYTSEATAGTFDLDKAKQLIAESSYGSVDKLPPIVIYSAGGGLDSSLSEILYQNLGIKVEVRELEWADYLDGLAQRNFQAFILSWIADYPDPQNFLGMLFGSSSGENHTHYSSPEADGQLDQAAVERDLATREQDYARVEQTVLSDAPVVPLYHDINYVLMKPYVKGLRVTPQGVINLKDAWIQKH